MTGIGRIVVVLCLLALSVQVVLGVGNEGDVPHGLDPMLLGGVAALLLIAKLGGELFERLRQPAVLGEVFGGVVAAIWRSSDFMGFEPLSSVVAGWQVNSIISRHSGRRFSVISSGNTLNAPGNSQTAVYSQPFTSF